MHPITPSYYCRFVLCSLVYLVLSSSNLLGDSRKKVTFSIDASGFNASRADINAVCRSAASELLVNIQGLEATSILISRGNKGPIVLFRRGPEGEHQVKLDTHKTFWAQYAYQVAHELCHVLCGYEDDYRGNLWFEETLCEVASLYCLRAMSEQWTTNAPYPNWKPFAPALRNYADNVQRSRDGFLEIIQTGLPAYYKKHANHLKKNPTDREKNGSMALALLPLFEREPEHWNAIQWLNSTPSKEGESFKVYFTKWRNAVPEKHRDFVETIGRYYGISFPDEL